VAARAEHLNLSRRECNASLMLPAEYMSQIVLPTVDEYLAATGDRRRAYLACIATYHVRDYLTRAEGAVSKHEIERSNREIERKMRGACAHSFDVVEGICNGSKHCGNSRDDFLFAPGAEEAVPVFAFDVPGSGWGVSRWDMPGLLVEHNGHRVFVDYSVCAALSAYGQIFPQRFASIVFQKYREWVSKSEV
jgi:hypothetical protein